MKRPSANMGKADSRKCEEGEVYERLGRATDMDGGEKMPRQARSSSSLRGLKVSSVQEQTPGREVTGRSC